ncbi:hypothetical protein LTR36_010021 [Oleoguttula mirabilis]|uniref:Uncharacterized protein n=1 Tax=Oleoguttula mirabilis TaxID=1507867 RepID=A0AAV9JT13_9PEZI|nr:hypothetical protein LTR36_010021 [Oleoguttula mirabilis]
MRGRRDDPPRNTPAAHVQQQQTLNGEPGKPSKKAVDTESRPRFGDGSLDAAKFTYTPPSPPPSPPPTFMTLPAEIRVLIFKELARMIPDEQQKPAWAKDYIRSEYSRTKSPPHLKALTGYEGWLVNCIRAPYRLNKTCYGEACGARLGSR